jgi:hypothetical protein
MQACTIYLSLLKLKKMNKKFLIALVAIAVSAFIGYEVVSKIGCKKPPVQATVSLLGNWLVDSVQTNTATDSVTNKSILDSIMPTTIVNIVSINKIVFKNNNKTDTFNYEINGQNLDFLSKDSTTKIAFTNTDSTLEFNNASKKVLLKKQKQ